MRYYKPKTHDDRDHFVWVSELGIAGITLFFFLKGFVKN